MKKTQCGSETPARLQETCRATEFMLVGISSWQAQKTELFKMSWEMDKCMLVKEQP